MHIQTFKILKKQHLGFINYVLYVIFQESTQRRKISQHSFKNSIRSITLTFFFLSFHRYAKRISPTFRERLSTIPAVMAEERSQTKNPVFSWSISKEQQRGRKIRFSVGSRPAKGAEVGIGGRVNGHKRKQRHENCVACKRYSPTWPTMPRDRVESRTATTSCFLVRRETQTGRSTAPNPCF